MFPSRTLAALVLAEQYQKSRLRARAQSDSSFRRGPENGSEFSYGFGWRRRGSGGVHERGNEHQGGEGECGDNIFLVFIENIKN